MAILKPIVSLTRTPRTARGLEAALYVASGAWLAATIGLAVIAAQQFSLGAIAFVIMPLAMVLIGAAGVTVISIWAELYGQRARDIEAQAVLDALRRGEAPAPFSLYLRPFASTDVISETGGMGLQGERIELELQLERAVRPIGRLVALGAPLEHIGAGRIQVADDTWQDAIRLLMDNAQLIIMLPSSRPGTLREIAIILGSDLVRRTVMIDPPNIAAMRRAEGYDQGAEWAAVQEAFNAAGYELPADETRRGVLLFYGEARKPKLKERLDIDAEDRIERLFRRVMKLWKAGKLAGAPARA